MYIWKMDGKTYIYLANQAFSTVNLPHSLHAISHLYLMFKFGSIRRCLAFLEKYIGEFLMIYKK